MRILPMMFVLFALLITAGPAAVSSSPAQQAYSLRFLGLSPSTPPADSLALRRALAYAIDREAVAKAVAPYLPRAPRAAVTIQHPALPGFNPGIRGPSFDPPQARELFRQSDWTGTITIFAGPRTNRFLRAFNAAVIESARKSLEAPIAIQQVVNTRALVKAATAGSAALFLLSWTSDPGDFGYPSIALGIAHALVADREVRVLLEQHDSDRVEQMLLDKALIVPIIHY